MSAMHRVNRILENSEYKTLLHSLTELEKDREFCKHTMEHFLDTARIMYIMALEDGIAIDKELIYAASLLHDIGRVKQYENGTPHDIASGDFARELLPKCGFDADETEAIISAILGHRGGDDENVLAKLLYIADKKSRLCFCCEAEKDCYWDINKKNFTVEI